MRDQLTLKYFQDLKVLAANCDRSVEIDADVKMLDSLKNKLDDLNRYTHNILDKVEELDSRGYWDSEEQKETYVAHLKKHRDILLEEQQAIDPQKGISEKQGDRIRSSIDTLDDCAIGIYEDL